jgi:hypothetical protein
MHKDTRLYRALAASLLACMLRATEPVVPVPVLCLAAWDTRSQGLTSIETNALAFYRRAGFALHFDYYEKVSAEALRRYPVVIGMLSQLHQGTSVFNGPFGERIEAYMRDGGSFLFFSGPSYYGTADFAEMQNPFLKRFGAELLKEVPRNPARERTLVRILGYRYLCTTDIVKSPYTGGTEELYLPLDYTDAYIRTHTATLSGDWQVLATSGRDTAAYPYAAWLKGVKQPGRWPASPPVLAVCTVGKGRFALFTTSSEYFVWEACHWAFGDGFVLKNGGLRLMSGLLAQLAADSAFRAGGGPVATEETAGLPLQGVEAPVVTEKKEWYRHVLSRYLPAGYGVRSYIDCGALSDLPYTPERGRGCLGAASGELLRSPGKEMFHATAANARGVGDRPVTYRFSGLDSQRRYVLGLLLWSFDPGIGRDLSLTLGGKLFHYPLPSLQLEQAPHFISIGDVRPDAEGKLDAVFARGAGGTGLFSALNEVWLFESGPAEAADADTIAEAFDSLHEGFAVRFPQAKVWKGLIGARSPADGGAPVGELAQTARRAGLAFLAYTDPVGVYTSSSFAKLQAECAAASTPECAVYAGVSFADRYAERPEAREAMGMGGQVSGYVFQPLQTLPGAGDFGMPSSLFWKFFGGGYSGGRAAPPSLSQPGRNGIAPWHQRFWRGLDVMTFGDGGILLNDARPLYSDLLTSGYGPQPRVSGVYRTADDIVAAVQRGWLTLSSAPSPGAVATHAHATHATSGPVIRAFQAADDHFNGYGTGGGLLFNEPGWFVLNLNVAHTGSLSRVTLYANRLPVRSWYPGTATFAVTEPIRLQTAAEYRLHVEAADGSEAFSGRFQAVARKFATSMCADNQNTITTLFKAPSRFVFDERELYLQHSYWHTGEAGGQLGVMRNAAQLVPRVDETGIIQPCKYFHPCPSISFRGRPEENHQWAVLRIVESSPDAAQISYSYSRTNAAFRSRTTLTSYRPSEGGLTAVFIETELQAQRTVVQEELKRITLVDLAVRPDLASDWRFVALDRAGVETASGAFTKIAKGASEDLALGLGGLAGLWPHEIGNLFVASCDAAAKRIAFTCNESGRIARERMTVFLQPRAFAMGEVATFRHVVFLAPGEFRNVEALKAMQARVLWPVSDLHLRLGTRVGTGPDIVCQAEKEYAAGGSCYVASGRHDPIPLEVRGVRPGWPLALEDASGLKLLGAGSDTLRTVIPPATGSVTFTAGNLLLADSSDVRIEVDTVSKKRVRFLVHNPTTKALICEIRANAAFTSVPSFRKRVTLAPGATVWRDSAEE